MMTNDETDMLLKFMGTLEEYMRQGHIAAWSFGQQSDQGELSYIVCIQLNVEDFEIIEGEGSSLTMAIQAAMEETILNISNARGSSDNNTGGKGGTIN